MTLEGKIEEALRRAFRKVSYCVCYLRVSKALEEPYTHRGWSPTQRSEDKTLWN